MKRAIALSYSLSLFLRIITRIIRGSTRIGEYLEIEDKLISVAKLIRDYF